MTRRGGGDPRTWSGRKHDAEYPAADGGPDAAASQPTLTFLTDFADQAVILPLVAVIAAILAAQRRWRVAAAWLLAIPGVLGIVLALKVACYACGWLVPAFDPDALALRSPSGHVASAAVVYGSIATLVAARSGLGAIPATLPVAVGMALLIGTTRVRLGAHSLSEVAVAAVVGVAGAAAFAWLAGRRAAERSALPALAGTLLVLVIVHGRHLPAEGMIQRTLAATLRQWVPACRLG